MRRHPSGRTPQQRPGSRLTVAALTTGVSFTTASTQRQRSGVPPSRLRPPNPGFGARSTHRCTVAPSVNEPSHAGPEPAPKHGRDSQFRFTYHKLRKAPHATDRRQLHDSFHPAPEQCQPSDLLPPPRPRSTDRKHRSRPRVDRSDRHSGPSGGVQERHEGRKGRKEGVSAVAAPQRGIRCRFSRGLGSKASMQSRGGRPIGLAQPGGPV